MSARPRKRGRRGGGAPAEVAPSVTRADLEGKTVAELKVMAEELSIDTKTLKKKDDLIAAVLEAKVKQEGFVDIVGILDILPEGYGFIRTSGYLPGDRDVYCSMTQVRRYQLRRGDMVRGQVRPPKETEKYAALLNVHSINGKAPEANVGRPDFRDLTPVYPDEKFKMEWKADQITDRIIDLVAPIGKGLQIDFGKWVTPNGAEVIETNQNWNYSRSLLFSWAMMLLFSLIDLLIASRLFKLMLYKVRADATLDLE